MSVPFFVVPLVAVAALAIGWIVASRRVPDDPYEAPLRHLAGSLQDGRLGESSTDEPEPVALPIDGVLDLHTFHPRDVADLVPTWLDECQAASITERAAWETSGPMPSPGIRQIVRDKLITSDGARTASVAGSGRPSSG